MGQLLMHQLLPIKVTDVNTILSVVMMMTTQASILI